MTGRAECAYLFPERLKERLDEGHYTRAVRVLVSPSTVAEKIISEKIFSELFEVYGRELLADYGKNGAAFQTVMARCQTTEAREKACGVLMELYEKYRSNGSTFTFDYQTLQGGTALQTGAMKVVFPVRGLTAVFLFIMGLAAAVMAGEDAERGLYAAVRSRERWLLQTAEIAAFVFLATISAYAALLVSGNGAEPLLEAGKAAFLSLLRDHVCLWMPGSLPETGISGGADSGVYPCEPPALSDLFDASLFCREPRVCESCCRRGGI